MTIADNIDFLNDAKKLFEDIANNPSINETIKTYFIIESLENAIEIMHKYQKIEQMLYEFKDMTYAPCLMKGHKCAVYEILNEVVEDGNE